MKGASIAIIFTILLNSCFNQVPKNSASLEKEICGLDQHTNYHTYLNQLIELQRKHPATKNGKVSFKVKLNVIRPMECTPLVDEDFSPLFTYMNASFEEANIAFEQESGVNYLFSDAPVDVFYHNGGLEKEFTKRHYDSGVINIYIVQNTDQVVGFTHYPIENSQRLFIAREKLFDPSLIHELGHFFGLLHTFESDLHAAEKVLSCDKVGDKICDTPQDVPGGASFIESDCTLFGEYKNSAGKAYTPDLTNYMSYYGSCRTRFSPLQLERMYFIAKNIKISQMRTKV